MISTAQSRTILSAGEACGQAMGVPVSLVVLDAGTHLKAISRMDSAPLGSIDIAIGKARTAVLLAMPSEAVWDYCRPGGVAPGLERSNGGLVTFGGGIPLTDAEGSLIGAVGVSGGTVTEDLAIAQAAAAALSA